MTDQKREHRRIEKPLSILYSLENEIHPKWDMSTIKNISVGGVMFIASSDAKLEKDKILYLKIKFPELAPDSLELEAVICSIKASFNSRLCEVRAKFINLPEEKKKHLAIVEKMIQAQDAKNRS